MHRLAFVCLVLAGLLLPVSHADAGALICKFTYSGSHDRQRLQTAMQAVLPDEVSAKDVPSMCRNRGSARAWLNTVPRLRPDGATEWWDVRCDRDAREWTCQSPTHRQLIWVFAELGGIYRRLEITFDDATGLVRARTLSVRAMKILHDPTSSPVSVCGARPGDDPRREWEKVQQSFALKPTDTAVELSVDSREPGSVDVYTGDDTLSLTLTDGSGASPKNELCWQQWVIVT